MSARNLPGWLRVVVALLALHLFVSFGFWFEHHDTGVSWKLVPTDLLLALACGGVLVVRFGHRWYVSALVALALTWITALRTAESICREFFERELELHDDVYLLDGLWVYLAGAGSRLQSLAIAAGVLLAIGILSWLVYVCVRCVLRRCEHRAFAMGMLGVAQFAVLVLWFEVSRHPQRPSLVFATSMTAHTLRHAREAVLAPGYEVVVATRSAAARSERALHATNLAALGGADVWVMFVESYGRTVFRDGPPSEELQRRLRGWQRELSARGVEVCSSFVASPAVGAGSVMAHRELLAGFPIESYPQANLLLRNGCETMAHCFGRAGYLTVDVQPKLEVEWPEGKALGFERQFFGIHTRYEADGGQRYHWALGPDQYYLACAMDEIVRASERPVFLFFVSTTSHAPFRLIPPYVEDWKRATDPRLHAPLHDYRLGMIGYKDDPAAEAAFFATITYSLQTIVGMVQQLDRPSLLLVLGDHQPPLLTERRRTKDVPIHVISNRPALLEPFLAGGFEPGFVPSPETTSFRMAQILPRMLRGFSR